MTDGLRHGLWRTVSSYFKRVQVTVAAVTGWDEGKRGRRYRERRGDAKDDGMERERRMRESKSKKKHKP